MFLLHHVAGWCLDAERLTVTLPFLCLNESLEILLVLLTQRDEPLLGLVARLHNVVCWVVSEVTPDIWANSGVVIQTLHPVVLIKRL